jgi:hypothetical protein
LFASILAIQVRALWASAVSAAGVSAGGESEEQNNQQDLAFGGRSLSDSSTGDRGKALFMAAANAKKFSATIATVRTERHSNCWSGGSKPPDTINRFLAG